MFSIHHLLVFVAISVLPNTAALTQSFNGADCLIPLGPGTAVPGEPFWLESIKHQGTSAFNPDPTYTVFRNVRTDFGAVGKCTGAVGLNCLLQIYRRRYHRRYRGNQVSSIVSIRFWKLKILFAAMLYLPEAAVAGETALHPL